MAGGFVAMVLAVAFLAYAANRHGDPSEAATVDDVAELAIEAVDNGDTALAERLACADGVPTDWARTSATAMKSEVRGEAAGSFVLSINDSQHEFTVGHDGKRSCIETITPRG